MNGTFIFARYTENVKGEGIGFSLEGSQKNQNSPRMFSSKTFG